MHSHTLTLISLLLSYGLPVWAETDPASLARLHDIQVPAPVSAWWPLAPGWYLLAGLLVGAVSWGLWSLGKRRRAGRYRREALAELRSLRRSGVPSQKAVVAILILLKRTALAVYPRPRVAALSGAAWWAFLDRTCGKSLFGERLGNMTERWVYTQQPAEAISARDLKRLHKAARYWIRHHSADRLSAWKPVIDAGPAVVETQGRG
jgi:hypothetical protein